MNPSKYFPKKYRINFKKNLRIGTRIKVKGVELVVVQNKNISSSKPGVIISKKVSNLAVVRNKYRRILKEIFRLDFELLEYKDLVFIVNKKILDLDFNRIRKELSKVRKYIFNEKIDSVFVDNAN